MIFCNSILSHKIKAKIIMNYKPKKMTSHAAKYYILTVIVSSLMMSFAPYVLLKQLGLLINGICIGIVMGNMLSIWKDTKQEDEIPKP